MVYISVFILQVRAFDHSMECHVAQFSKRSFAVPNAVVALSTLNVPSFSHRAKPKISRRCCHGNGSSPRKVGFFFYRLAIIELSSYCTLESFASLTEIIRRFEKMRHILKFALRDGFVGC